MPSACRARGREDACLGSARPGRTFRIAERVGPSRARRATGKLGTTKSRTQPLSHERWDVRVPTAADAAMLARPIEGSGLFAPGEAADFVAMLPDLLADPGARWRALWRGTAIAGAAYASRERMSADVWNLWFIGLLVADHGQGGGTALLAAMERAARAEGGRLLLVETSSAPAFAPARLFYRARGYGEEARIGDYYGAGEDKVIFRKAL